MSKEPELSTDEKVDKLMNYSAISILLTGCKFSIRAFREKPTPAEIENKGKISALRNKLREWVTENEV